MTFSLGNIQFGGRVIMIVDGRPTIELPCGMFIQADSMPDPEPFVYASWTQLCDCGRNYGNHPKGGSFFQGAQFLRRICDGRLVKL